MRGLPVERRRPRRRLGRLPGRRRDHWRGRGVVPPAAIPAGLVATIGVDLLLDGVLVGVGATLGSRQALILTIALTLEILFLALSVTAELTERGASRAAAAAVPSLLGLLTAVGAIAGAAVFGNASRAVQAAVLAFGAAALLYLVTEELLTEAHETHDTPPLTAAFFAGFILIYALAA